MTANPFKIGIQLPEAERPVRWTELMEMARRAEALGYDSIWIGDHLLYRTPGDSPRGPWEAWSLLAALAVATTRVEIGPLVACTSFHSPAMIAKKAATIDEISGGRLILGLGAGWHEPEYRGYGFPYDRRASRFAEAFAVIRGLLQEGEVDFDGRYYQIRDCVLTPRGPRPAGPPLMVGSNGPRMLAATLPHVDAWNAWYGDYDNDLAKLPALLARIDDACRAAGRDPATLSRTVAVLVGMSGSRGRPAIDPAEAALPPITGNAKMIARTLLEFHRLGISHLQIVLDPITIESIEEFAAVIELVRREASARGSLIPAGDDEARPMLPGQDFRLASPFLPGGHGPPGAPRLPSG